jgi:tetratricopeptide (TPR) repeat protein
LNVHGYHVVNLAIHLCSALLLFGLVRRTLSLPSLRNPLAGIASACAFAVSLIWAVHPLNTEAVVYVTQRTESMMAMFYLLTMYAARRALDSPQRRQWQAVAVCSCAFGMASKEVMVTAPLMVGIYDRVFVFASWRDALLRRWPLYLALATTWGILAVLLWSDPRPNSAGFATDVGPWTYLLNQAVIICRYLGLAFWPRSLVLYYGPPLPLTLQSVFLPFMFLVLLLLLTGVALLRRPALGFLGVWFFVLLAPTSSLIPITTEVGAERRMYLPLIAIILLVAIGGVLAWHDWQRIRLKPDTTRAEPWRPASAGPANGRAVHVWAPWAILAAVAALLMTGTISRNREYESAVSMARTVVARRPMGVTHHLLGMELIAAGQREEGLQQLREAIHTDPRARYNLGVQLIQAGELREGIDQLEAFTRAEPTLPQVQPARLTMGGAFAKEKKWPEAIEQFRLVLHADPLNADARRYLAEGLFFQESFDAALPHFLQYLEAKPDDAEALTMLGLIYISKQNLGEAIPTFQRAVTASPRNALARRNLGEALLERGEPGDAERHARQAATLAPQDAASHDLLGRALAAQGKTREAVVEFRRALEIDPTNASAQEALARMAPTGGTNPR